LLKPCLQNLKMRMSSSAISCCTSLTCPLAWSQHQQETSMGLSAATVGLVLHPICCTTTSIMPRCRCHRFMTSSAAMHAAACSTCIAHERFCAKGAMPGRQASSGVPVSLLPANFEMASTECILIVGWNHTSSPSAHHLCLCTIQRLYMYLQG